MVATIEMDHFDFSQGLSSGMDLLWDLENTIFVSMTSPRDLLLGPTPGKGKGGSMNHYVQISSSMSYLIIINLTFSYLEILI